MAKIQAAGSVPGKETVYVDVDDEITAIIDKVRAAKGKVIALVLPKRASVLQSIVNMKLLQRTAENAGKHLVLITSEAGLMPLAGSVGLYVADSPTSKPTIPPAPVGPSDEAELIDEPLNVTDGSTDAPADDFDSTAAADQPVGELATTGGASKIAEKDIDEDINLDDDTGAAPAATGSGKNSQPKKNKKLAVPNFDSFRKKMLLAGGIVVLLGVLLVLAVVILPKATITIHTDSSVINSNLNLTLDTKAQQLNSANNTVPATADNQQKTSTQTVPATGQKNNGQTASGTITMTDGSCSGDVPSSVPAGNSLSSGNQTYTLNSSVSFTPTVSHGKCTFTGVDSNGNASIGITALHPGANYNQSGGFNISGRSDVTANGSASGGTDNITKVVAQSDIDNATSKIKAADTTSIKQQLANDLQGKGLQAIQTTFLPGTPQVTTSNKAGDAADNVTVTAVTTYTMLGVQKSVLQKLVDTNVNNQIDKSKQTILDDGVANATFSLQNQATATSASVSASVKSVAGPMLNATQLKTLLAGKKSGDVKSTLAQTPGVTTVDIHYSPFWVSSVPKSAKKITIVVDKPSTTQ